MKKVILILFSLSLLTACSIESNNENKSSIKLSDGSKQISELYNDIETKYNSLSLNQKLELCVQAYSLEYPKRYLEYLSDPEFDIKYLLFNDKNFIKICNNRNVDLSNIPADYFSPDGTPAIEFVDAYLLNNIENNEKKLLSEEEYLNSDISKDKKWEILKTFKAIKK